MLDLSRIRALCFDVDGTLADTDDHIVQRLASVLDALPWSAVGARSVWHARP
jgi:phosphoglycolate phosphatase